MAEGGDSSTPAVASTGCWRPKSPSETTNRALLTMRFVAGAWHKGPRQGGLSFGKSAVATVRQRALRDAPIRSEPNRLSACDAASEPKARLLACDSTLLRSTGPRNAGLGAGENHRLVAWFCMTFCDRGNSLAWLAIGTRLHLWREGSLSINLYLTHCDSPIL